jgi:hypothetical protein
MTARANAVGLYHGFGRALIVAGLAVFFLLGPALPPHASAKGHDGVAGVWVSVKGPTDFDSMEFVVEDGAQIFRSWMHNRPAWFGSWTLDGTVLTVTMQENVTLKWTVVSVSKKKLVLLAEGEKKKSVYRRVRMKR